jgi:hypothetical protein
VTVNVYKCDVHFLYLFLFLVKLWQVSARLLLMLSRPAKHGYLVQLLQLTRFRQMAPCLWCSAVPRRSFLISFVFVAAECGQCCGEHTEQEAGGEA